MSSPLTTHITSWYATVGSTWAGITRTRSPTFAEMTRAEKERVSHRGRAFRALAAGLRDRGVV